MWLLDTKTTHVVNQTNIDRIELNILRQGATISKRMCRDGGDFDIYIKNVTNYNFPFRFPLFVA